MIFFISTFFLLHLFSHTPNRARSKQNRKDFFPVLHNFICLPSLLLLLCGCCCAVCCWLINYVSGQKLRTIAAAAATKKLKKELACRERALLRCRRRVDAVWHIIYELSTQRRRANIREKEAAKNTFPQVQGLDFVCGNGDGR